MRAVMRVGGAEPLSRSMSAKRGALPAIRIGANTRKRNPQIFVFTLADFRAPSLRLPPQRGGRDRSGQGRSRQLSAWAAAALSLRFAVDGLLGAETVVGSAAPIVLWYPGPAGHRVYTAHPGHGLRRRFHCCKHPPLMISFASKKYRILFLLPTAYRKLTR